MTYAEPNLMPLSDDEYRALKVLPLSRLPGHVRHRIEAAVRRMFPPPKRLHGEWGTVPSRSWFEWYLRRSRKDPRRKRRSVPVWMREAVLRRDGYRCHICGGEVRPDDVHLDHVVPYIHGGATSLENLRVSHSVCNIRKGAGNR